MITIDSPQDTPQFQFPWKFARQRTKSQYSPYRIIQWFGNSHRENGACSFRLDGCVGQDRFARRTARRSTAFPTFVEHMVFKGTKSRSAQKIAREVDAIGGNLDAFTSKETICFNIKVLDEHVPKALDVLTRPGHATDICSR